MLNYRGTEVQVAINRYANNGNVAVLLVGMDGIPEAYGSINTDLELPPDEFVVHHNMPADGRQSLLDSQLFEDTGKTTSYGHVRDQPIFRVVFPFTTDADEHFGV